jgi:outer membrane protein OmpA-like peptidoglycan-associated protein
MLIGRLIAAAILLAIPAGATAKWIGSAEGRLVEAQATPASSSGQVAVAAASDVEYCNPELKKILRRVLMSCGLMGGDAARGCQPVQAKNVATMSGSDFNALFRPMKERGGIVQFDKDKSELDKDDLALVDKVFADQRGASYFFVVARASPEGSVTHNRELSKARAETVMKHLKEQFKDPDLEKEVGMLWLGEEFAQLEDEFCQWRRSSNTECGGSNNKELNRSAFVAWIDCQL